MSRAKAKVGAVEEGKGGWSTGNNGTPICRESLIKRWSKERKTPRRSVFGGDLERQRGDSEVSSVSGFVLRGWAVRTTGNKKIKQCKELPQGSHDSLLGESTAKLGIGKGPKKKQGQKNYQQHWFTLTSIREQTWGNTQYANP